jgi:hypothetical protein
MEDVAISAHNQEEFVVHARNLWRIIREHGRMVYKALRVTLVETGRWPGSVGGTFAQQVEAWVDEKIARQENPQKGEALKQLNKDRAANKHGAWVQIARRIARDLAQHGPITIDDVTSSMKHDYKVAAGEGDSAHNWKGSVFATSEWVAVGHVPSRVPKAHGRKIILWALKSWHESHTLNGRGDVVSSFNLTQIYNDFKHKYGNDSLKRCRWCIGTDTLSDDIKNTIGINHANTLYEIPVSLLPNTVGAILTSLA